MAQQQNQIYGYSSAIYFDSPPFPSQNYQPPQNEQSNSRKRPSILGANRVVKEPVEEKKIKITEENRIEVEKIMAATRVKKPHRALQSAHDPFMGNQTDSEGEEASLSDDELEQIEDQSYVILSKKRDLLHRYSLMSPPKFGEEATAELPDSPEKKREFVPVNRIEWPPLDAMDGVMKELVPGTPLYSAFIRSFETDVPTESSESKKMESRRRRLAPLLKCSKKCPSTAFTPMPSVFSGSDRSATQSPPSITSEPPKLLVQMAKTPEKTPVTPKLIQKVVNTPEKTSVKSKRKSSVESQSSTSAPQESSSSKKKESKEPPPRKASDLENLNTLKMFLNQAAPIEVVNRENELLDQLKRQKKGLKPRGLLMEMLKDANSL